MVSVIGFFVYIVVFLSLIGLLVGFIMVFDKRSKKTGIQILLFSAMALLIGFGTCAVIFKW